MNLDPIRAANIACTARDSKGVVIPNAIPALVAPPLGHWAGFNFPALTGANGAVSCVSSVKIAAVALRSLGTEAISSLPVAAPKNSSAGSQVTSSLPHFAVGESFSTDLYIVNGGDQPATFSMSLLDDSGASVGAPFRGLGVQSTIVDSVPAHGTRRYEARAEQDNAALKSGWVLIQGDPTVTAQALLRRQTTGNIVYEAAIPSTLGANELRIAFDGAVFVPTGAQTFTGVAIANLERSFARVECVARGAEGIVIPGAIAALELGPLGHWAAFDFPKLAGQRGSIDCVSNTKIGAVALRALGAEAISTLPVLLVDH